MVYQKKVIKDEPFTDVKTRSRSWASRKVRTLVRQPSACIELAMLMNFAILNTKLACNQPSSFASAYFLSVKKSNDWFRLSTEIFVKYSGCLKGGYSTGITLLF